jgi:hypothetical protein
VDVELVHPLLRGPAAAQMAGGEPGPPTCSATPVPPSAHTEPGQAHRGPSSSPTRSARTPIPDRGKDLREAGTSTSIDKLATMKPKGTGAKWKAGATAVGSGTVALRQLHSCAAAPSARGQDPQRTWWSGKIGRRYGVKSALGALKTEKIDLNNMAHAGGDHPGRTTDGYGPSSSTCAEDKDWTRCVKGGARSPPRAVTASRAPPRPSGTRRRRTSTAVLQGGAVGSSASSPDEHHQGRSSATPTPWDYTPR